MTEEKFASRSTSMLPDRAIDDPAQDFLNRRVFADALVEQVLHVPPDQTLRLGVYGGWGEGKTSVLQLMRRRLEKEGHVCLWLAPWAARTRDEVLSTLLEQLATRLKIDPNSLTGAQRAAGIATRTRDAAASGAWWAVAAEKFFGERLQRGLDQRVDEEVEQFLASVTSRLGEKRVIVFVDDLDRVRADFIAELLLTLRETLDRSNFFYVLALAPEVVQRGLEAYHAGWGNSTEFLEKIVEFPRYLPTPTENEIALFLRQSMAALGRAALDPDALQAVAPLLPRNPRKLKLFLRTMASLRGILQRFDPSEIDLTRLYVVQLLRSEFPTESRRLFVDPEGMKDLREGAFRDHLATKDGETPPRPSDKYLPVDAPADAKLRFDALFRAAQNRNLWQRGRYDVASLLTLPDAPPIVTWGEFARFVDGYRTADEPARREQLRRYLSVDGTMDVYRAEAVFPLALELRQVLLERAADVDLAGDLSMMLQEVKAVTEIVSRFVDELGAFSDPLLSIEAWKALLTHVSKWAHFTKPIEYDSLRQEERQLLMRAIATMNSVLHGKALETFNFDFSGGQPKEFLEFVLQLRARLAHAVGDAILEAFLSAEGLEAYWSETGRRGVNTLLLRCDSVLFSDQKLRARFENIASESSTNPTVQRNFVDYLERLLYEATEGGHLNRDEARAFLDEGTVVTAIWNAALCTPLNPRTVGTLRQRRERLARDYEISPERLKDLLPLPRWWMELEATFFTAP